jgi:molecular chaperone HtpG
LSDTDKASRGTAVTLHLKAVDPESGIENLTDKWILSRIVKRYSDFINYPIVFKTERDQAASFEASEVEDEILNSQKPIWARPQSELTQSEYTEFYKYLSHDFEEPLHTLSARAEGLIDYQALVFIPAKAPFDLYYHASESGLRLYSKGVLVMEQCPDLLPRYLRFMKGLVDSADLPLNISRQMLQQERQLSQIRKWLTKKILDALHNMYLNDEEKYLRFWEQFGRAIKEGVGSDFDNKERIVSLLLYESSQDAEKLSTLKSYVERMKEGQQEIFYITGESRSVVEHSPHLEAFKAKGYEVLYLIDPVDELVVQYLTEYEGKKLKSINKGTVKLGNEEEQAQAERELKKRTEETSALLQYLQKSLNEYIKEVRLTNRLTTSPVCLVGADSDYSPQMERLLQMGNHDRPRQKRIMELNPAHEVFAKLLERFQKDEADPALAKYGELLLGYALLAEGSELPDRVKFNSLVAELITQTL